MLLYIFVSATSSKLGLHYLALPHLYLHPLTPQLNSSATSPSSLPFLSPLSSLLFPPLFPSSPCQAEDAVVERKMLKKDLVESLISMLDRTFAGSAALYCTALHCTGVKCAVAVEISLLSCTCNWYFCCCCYCCCA